LILSSFSTFSQMFVIKDKHEKTRSKNIYKHFFVFISNFNETFF
jgi:hypothetical protein